MWITKHRYRVIDGRIVERTRRLIIHSCSNINVIIIKVSIGREQVYILVILPSSLSVSKSVQQLKVKISQTVKWNIAN